MGTRSAKNERVPKESFINTAMELFAKHGFEGTSFQMIADVCGVSQSTVIYNFPSKLELIKECINAVLQNNHNIVKSSVTMNDNAIDRLKKHFYANLEWAVEYRREAQLILLLYYVSTYNGEFAALYEKIRTGARNRIEEIMAAGQREKIFKKDLDQKWASEVLHDALLGGIVNFITVNKENKKDIKTKWDLLFKKLCLITEEK